MELSVTVIKHLLLAPNISESEIISHLKNIHLNFTLRRHEITRYVESEEMVSAYTLFYFPTNLLKLNFVLNQLSSNIQQALANSTILDFGSGPGTYSIGFLNFFRENFEGSLILVDKSDLMLRQAKKLMDNFFPKFQRIKFQNNLQSIPEGDVTLFFGNSINELGVEASMKLIENIRPKFLFFIEPGTRDFFQTAMEIRTAMRNKKWQVLYPCPSLNDYCPLNQRGDWCHQVLHVTHDPSIERISQLIKRDRRTMPFISHLYLDEKNNDHISKARLVRNLGENKFAHVWEICLEEGNKTVLKKIEVIKKNLDKSIAKHLKKNLNIGVEVNFQIIKKVTQDYWRVSLSN